MAALITRFFRRRLDAGNAARNAGFATRFTYRTAFWTAIRVGLFNLSGATVTACIRCVTTRLAKRTTLGCRRLRRLFRGRPH